MDALPADFADMAPVIMAGRDLAEQTMSEREARRQQKAR